MFVGERFVSMSAHKFWSEFVNILTLDNGYRYFEDRNDVGVKNNTATRLKLPGS